MFRAPAFCVLGAEILNLPKIPLKTPAFVGERPHLVELSARMCYTKI